MGELEERLGAVLSDPAAMAEVTRLARQLMGGETAVPPPPGDGGAGSPPEEGGAGPLPGLLRQWDGRNHPLARAMAPYLGEARQRRLERALGVASAARMADSVLRGMGGIHGISSL